MAPEAYPTRGHLQGSAQGDILPGQAYNTMAVPPNQAPQSPYGPRDYAFPTQGRSFNPALHQFPSPHPDLRQQFPATHIERLPSGQLVPVGSQPFSTEIGPHPDRWQRSHFQHPSTHLVRSQFHGHSRYTRPSIPAGPGYSYANAPRTRFGDQQTDPRRRYQMQMNYLDSLAVPVIQSLHSLTPELQSKESLRTRLVKIAREAISVRAAQCGVSIGPDAIDLKCFGSLRNGFGLPGADMDLAMTTSPSNLPKEIEDECPRILEKAFLDAGFGARLIGKTRVPIIKLCEKPSQELLDVLKEERKAWEVKQLASDTTESFSGKETRTSSESENPDRSKTDDRVIEKPSVSVDFPGSDTGIHCDINFSGSLAIYNSELLRCYSLCDERVRLLGIFIKKWAKARKINSAYHGTLCSYGYILMVIHYLINVAQPPVIPNLQIDYRPPASGRKSTTTVSGYDVRFFNDEEAIRSMARTRGFSRNNQSVGELIRGFFAYYGAFGPNAPLGGFDWINGVISIRTRGGILTKSDKGWTSLHVDDNGTRHRYLLAIEDPFEVDYNVARTVVRDGVHAIRDEFRRANNIIHSIQEIPGAGWQWRTEEGAIGEDFFAEAEDRLHLQRTRQLRTLSGPSNEISEDPTEEKQRGAPTTARSVPGQNLGENDVPAHGPTTTLAYRPRAKGSNSQNKGGSIDSNRDGRPTFHPHQDKTQPLAANANSSNPNIGTSTQIASGNLQDRVSKPRAFRADERTDNRELSSKGKSICNVNPLIRRPVSEVTRKQEEMVFQINLKAYIHPRTTHLWVVRPLRCLQAQKTIRPAILDTRDTAFSDSDSATVHTHLSGSSDAISIPSVAITKPSPRAASSDSSQLSTGDSSRVPGQRGLCVDPKQLYEMYSIHTGKQKAGGVRPQIPFPHNPGSTEDDYDQDKPRVPYDELLRNLPFNQFVTPSSNL
ncbi:hypothetical protein DTO045G8_119 [Paecilomyces variotii]|nr:hypothetical protein DTO045G8_119 [Paecilomyces variotii]